MLASALYTEGYFCLQSFIKIQFILMKILFISLAKLYNFILFHETSFYSDLPSPPAGDLYGSIGSPVRLSRTVVVGRRQELVQRLLYVLTYFIRCSELLETHLLDSAEDEAIVMPGSLITTSLRKGEVEESDYVLVTVHKPSGDYLSQGDEGQQRTTAVQVEDGCGSSSSYRSGNSLQSSTYTDTDADPEGGDMTREEEGEEEDETKVEVGEMEGENDEEEEDEEEGSSASLGSRSSVLQTASGLIQKFPALRSEESEEPQGLLQEACSSSSSSSTVAAAMEATSPEDQSQLNPRPPPPPSCASMEAGAGPLSSLGFPSGKKPPDKNSAVDPAVTLTTTTDQQQQEEEEPATKVTFLIGDSMSPESDTESRRRRMEEQIKKHKRLLGDLHLLHPQAEQRQQQQQATSRMSLHSATEDQSRTSRGASALQRVSSRMPSWSSNCVDNLTEYYDPDSLHHPSGTSTTEDLAHGTLNSLHKDLLDPSGAPQPIEVRGHRSSSSSSSSKASDSRGSCRFEAERRCGCSSVDLCDSCCSRSCSAERDHGLLLLQSRGQKVKTTGGTSTINDWEIPRNESSDSALGDSETEDGEDWQEEMLVPFPGLVLFYLENQ